MGVCIICEREVNSSNLIDVISSKGIAKVCNHCYNEDMPLFNKPSREDFESVYKRKSVYNRLSEAAGLNLEEHKRRISEFGKQKSPSDDYLRKVANKNFEDKAKLAPKNESLIDNFHWIITRARRMKKLSQKQLAEKIGEPESAIILAEKGLIPLGNDLLVSKIEAILEIRISTIVPDKELSPYEMIQKEYLDKIKEEGEFDKVITESLTTDDLVSEGQREKKKRWRLFGRKGKKREDPEEDLDDSDFGFEE